MSDDKDLAETVVALARLTRLLMRQVEELTVAVILLQAPDPARPWFDEGPDRPRGTTDVVLREINADQEVVRATARRSQARGALHGQRDLTLPTPLGPEEPDGSYLAGYCGALAEEP